MSSNTGLAIASKEQPTSSTPMSGGMVAYLRRAPGAKAIRVSYQQGAILTDWIPVDEVPKLRSEWPRKL